jgi:hypothetical protein
MSAMRSSSWVARATCLLAILLAGPIDARAQDRRAVDNVLGIQVYGVGGGFVPLGANGTVTGVDQTTSQFLQSLGLGNAPFDIASQSGGTSSTTALLGARVHVPFLWRLTDEQRLSFAFFFETGFQSGLGAQSFVQTFQNVSTFAGDSGTNTINEFYQIPLLLGGTLPLGRLSSDGGPIALLDVYGGVTLDSWQQTLQGSEANDPSGTGFYGQSRRFTVDPTIGLGLRVPLTDLRSELPIFVGVNAELQFRPGSVVTVPSQVFPVTYYGTVNPYANLALMARIGISFGGR